jgi:dephospho-CoA kinase
MLRVGLTGDLGSGKSTVAALFAELGAKIFSSDDMARTMMQPGEPVYQTIVNLFGPAVLGTNNELDRRALARLAFEEGRVEELNAIIHPAVIAEQARLLADLAQSDSHAIAIVESALIFTAKVSQPDRATQPWRTRFDRVVLVRAPFETKLARFVDRLSAGKPMTEAEQASLEADARNRLALQSEANESHAADCLIIENNAGLSTLREEVEAVWHELQQAEAAVVNTR